MEDKMSIAVKVEIEIAGNKIELSINQLKELKNLIDIALSVEKKADTDDDWMKKYRDIKPFAPYPPSSPYPVLPSPWWEVRRNDLPIYCLGESTETV